MKIHAVVVDFLSDGLTDRQADMYDETNSNFSQFWECA